MDEPMMLSEDSSIWEAVSSRGLGGEGEGEGGDDDLYYIPERRPSLDLGPSSMDTSNWAFVDQALSPLQNYESMTSEEDSGQIEDDDESSTRVHLGRVGSFSSCYTVDSDDCEKKTVKVRDEEDVSEPANPLQLDLDPKAVGHPSLTIAFTFKAISDALKKLESGELEIFKRMLWTHFPQSFTSPHHCDVDIVDLVDRLLECYSLEAALKITKALLVDMDKKQAADFLQTTCIRNEVRYELSEILRKEYAEVGEDSSAEGEKRHLNEVFTDLYFSSNFDNGPNIEHEVMNIQKLNTVDRKEVPIPADNILYNESRAQPRIHLLTGMAGSGKSTAVRKVILDWAEGRGYQQFTLLIPLPLRLLKQFEGPDKVSFVDIMTTLYPPTKKINPEDLRKEDIDVMLVVDGVDEYCRAPDFRNTGIYSDPTRPTSLNTIIVNILRGRLYFYAYVLVTTRPTMHVCVPWDTLHDNIEVLGFRDPQREEYFRKRFKDDAQAAQVIEYVKSSKTLHIMCHLPLFCSLVGDEWQRVFTERGSGAAPPRGITYMYTKLLLELIHHRRSLRAPDVTLEEKREFLMKLGKLAWTLVEKAEFKISRMDWQEKKEVDVEAVVHTGLCMQFITTPLLFCDEKVVTFLHPTVQEYMAALYVYLSFTNTETVVLEQKDIKAKLKVLKGKKSSELYKCAVDKSLQCEDGRFDTFLVFLCGLLHKVNQELLQPLCGPPAKLENFGVDAAALIKKRMKENQQPRQNQALWRCLEELGV